MLYTQKPHNAIMIVCVYRKTNGRILHIHPSNCVKSDTDVEYVDEFVGIIWDNKHHRDLFSKRVASEITRLYMQNNTNDVCMLVDNFNCKPKVRQLYKDDECICIPSIPSFETNQQDVKCCMCLLVLQLLGLAYLLK